MPIKVGRVPDLNYEPFYIDMERRGIQLHEMPSNGVGPAVEKGEIDAGPIPLADCLGLEDRFNYVTGFCVTAWEKSGSMFLHSRKPIAELTEACIAIPGGEGSLDARIVTASAIATGIDAQPSASIDDALTTIARRATCASRVLISGSLYLAGAVLAANGGMASSAWAAKPVAEAAPAEIASAASV